MDSVPVRSPGGSRLRNELADALVRRIPDGCELVLLAADGHGHTVDHPRVRTETTGAFGGGLLGQWRWQHRQLPQLAAALGADVVYSLAGLQAARLTRRFGTVTTVNNMLPFLPQWCAQIYPRFKDRVRFKLLLHGYVGTLRRADAVVLHSQYALQTIGPFAGPIEDKTLVSLTGVPSDLDFDPAALPPHPYGENPYFFYLSAIGVYKNHLRLLQAYRRALDEEPELPELLIAGIPEEPDYLQRILAKIEELELEKKARYLGTVDRETIPAWLHHAEVNFFPSECETNSVVLAEILGVGGVLACSRCDPMPEVAGDAAELFDPHSVDEMADVMLRLHRQDERREELRQLARQRAAELSWDRCGEAIWKAAGTAKAAIERRRRGS